MLDLQRYYNRLIHFLDFEAILQPVEEEGSKTHKHIPICYAWIMSSEIESENRGTTVYTGLDCAKHFVTDMIELHNSVRHYFYKEEPIKMTDEDRNKFDRATNCYICGNLFTSNIVKVREHSHITGNQKIRIDIAL